MLLRHTLLYIKVKQEYIAYLLIFFHTDAVCDGSNGSDIYVPHEKIDQCRTYIRCFNYKPTGQICGPQLCFDHQKKYCDWCTAVACESEMSPTTEGKYIKISSIFWELIANIIYVFDFQ